ncbi:Histone H4, partial [Phytophthora megakarya]
MSGRGNGTKGVDQGGSKRRRLILRENIQSISRQSIRRLARRVGVTKTVTIVDVVYTLKRQGRTIYGFGK